MSFDRIVPNYDSQNFITSKVTNGEYSAISIPPTFRYRPDSVENIIDIKNFTEAINEMTSVTPERKEFLLSRYEYWMQFARLSDKGPLCGQEGE